MFSFFYFFILSVNKLGMQQIGFCRVFPARFTKPFVSRNFCDTHTLPMKPLYSTQPIVAFDHFPNGWLLTQAPSISFIVGVSQIIIFIIFKIVVLRIKIRIFFLVMIRIKFHFIIFSFYIFHIVL